MSKVDLRTLESVTGNDAAATALLNANFEEISEALDNAISRDGTAPNYMDANLDMNNKRLINLADPENDYDAINKKYFTDTIGNAASYASQAATSAAAAASSAQSSATSAAQAIAELQAAEATIQEAADRAVEEVEGRAEAELEDFVENTIKPDLQDKVNDASSYATAASGSATLAERWATSTTVVADGKYGSLYYAQQADSANTDAQSAKTDAQSARNTAQTAASNANIWAEGTDEQVQALGGIHSSKVWSTFGKYYIGQIVESPLPITDAGLHLLDGSLLAGGGIYSAFVTYIAGLYNTDPTANYFSQDGDVSFSQPTLTSDGTMGGDSFAVSASAESSTYEAYKAFDNNSSTYWRSGTTSGWLQFYNPIPVKVTNLTWGYYYSYPTGGDVQGSNDGSTWTTLKTWSNSSATDFDIDLSANTEYYKYYRINITGVNTDVIHCKQISIVGYTYVTAEAAWQQSVTDYGVCGKFVYDSVNNTVRLPKITGIVEGTTDLTALGDLVEAGLPNITGSVNFTRCEINGADGAFRLTESRTAIGANSNVPTGLVSFDASRSSSIYGNSTTVQPQTIKVLYYIVVATSTKTEIEVDIDEIATDLNGKADVDLSNINPTTTVKKQVVSWCMPDYDAGISITGIVSGTGTYIAEYTGLLSATLQANNSWVYFRKGSSTGPIIASVRQTGTIGGYDTITAEVQKDDVIWYELHGTLAQQVIYPFKGANNV